MRDRPDVHPLSGLTASLFRPAELRAVLGAYSTGVMRKGWRDYGISSEENRCVFAVLDKTVTGTDFSAAIEKRRAHKGKKFFYRVFDRSKQVISTDNFREALNAFSAIGEHEDDGKPPKGNRHLKLVK